MRWFAVAIACVLMAPASAAKAGVTDWSCTSGSNGAVSCTSNGWTDENSPTVYDVSISGSQYWAPGQMIASFTTSSTQDPTLHYMNGIVNDTSFPWTGYQVAVTLDAADQLTSYALYSPVVSAPGDWTATMPELLTPNPDNPVDGQYQYTGIIDFSGGTPVVNGGELDFSYYLSFAGSTNYSAVQVLTPISVPEPGTLALLACGLLALACVRRRLFA